VEYIDFWYSASQPGSASFLCLTSAREQKGDALGKRDESTTDGTGIDWTLGFSNEVVILR